MKILKGILSLIIIGGIVFALYSLNFKDIGEGISEKLAVTPLKSEVPKNDEQVFFYDASSVLPDAPFYNDTAVSAPQKITGHWYDNMNERQKQYYRLILAAFEDMSDSFFEIAKNDAEYKNNLSIAYNGVLADNPEIFWQDNTYKLKISDNSCLVKLGYCMDKSERDQKREQLNERLAELLKPTEDMSDFEKEIFFFEFLCDNTNYCETENTQKYTAYGALCEGAAVCEGYSKAMQLLCKKSGIGCLLVRGVTGGRQHIWNLVQLSNCWYELDVTQSDRKDASPNLFYFNATTEEISLTHNRLPDVFLQPNGDFSSMFYNFNLPTCDAVIFSRNAAMYIGDKS